MIVFQPNINKPTEELAAEALKAMMAHPANNELISNYRQMKHQMAEAEARQAVEEFVNEVVATDDYKKALAAELKKDEHRRKKLVPTSDLERVKWYIGRKKSSLPAMIPTIAYFLESKDRWGRVGLWRLQQYGYLSGLAVVDGDHVPNVEAVIAEWLQREDFNELGIVCIFITPSGEGVKVIFKAREEWGNLQDNAYTMAEKLGVLDYADGQTKNSDHAHFIPKADDVKFIDWEALFTYENPAYEQKYGEAYRRGESEPTQPRWQEFERQRKEARKGTQSTQKEPSLLCMVEHVHQWCDDRRAIAEFNDKDKADWLLIKRVPYYGISISAPYIDMRHWQEREQTGTYTIDAQDLALCDLVLDIQYRTQIFWYYELHRQYYANQLRDAVQQRRRTTKFQECFRQLPEEFSTEQFAKTFGYANNHAGQKTLERLLNDKAISRTKRGSYKKLTSEL